MLFSRVSRVAAGRVGLSRAAVRFASAEAGATKEAAPSAASVGSSMLPLAAAAAAAAAAAGAGGYYYLDSQPTVDYKAVKAAIADVLEDDDHDVGSYGPIFVRLAWHCSGTYDKKALNGGSEGAAMRFAPEGDWPANTGLAKARARLEPVKAQFPGLSYSDLWVLAGSTAIEEMGGPDLPFRSGRADKSPDSAPLPDGRLPNPTGGDTTPAAHLRDVFYRMNFDDKDIVALSGAHTLGRCHATSSRYVLPWTRAETTFSNMYFTTLLGEKWTIKKLHEGKPWQGPEQFEDATGDLMMLPSDVVLLSDAKFRPHVDAYAKDEDAFFKDFVKVWTTLTENGCQNLSPAPVA